MLNLKKGGVKHRPGCFRGIGDGRTMERPVIDPFPAQGCAAFTKVDAYLMSPARFETAFNERVVTDFLNQVDVSDRTLAILRVWTGATTTITTILDKGRFDPLRPGVAADKCDILPLNGMLPHL